MVKENKLAEEKENKLAEEKETTQGTCQIALQPKIRKNTGRTDVFC